MDNNIDDSDYWKIIEIDDADTRDRKKRQRRQHNMVALATYFNDESEASLYEEDDDVQWGGSKPGKAPNKNRDFANAYTTILFFRRTERLQ
jgi:hypothetical protein